MSAQKRGRPIKGVLPRDQLIKVRADIATVNMLDELCITRNVSRTDLIAKLIATEYNRAKHTRTAAAEMIESRRRIYADE